MSSENCFFKPSLPADGKPYIYSCHKTGKIAGGVGPTGSISYNSLDVEVPRSKYARKVHLIALGIKVLSVAFFPALIYDLFQFNNQPKYLLIFVGLGIFTGFILVYSMYWKLKVKPIFRHARKFPEVEKYLKNGYSQGPHAFVTTTPFGLLYHFAKWIF